MIELEDDIAGRVYGYGAYGQSIRSSLPLPELTEEEAPEPGITIRRGRVDRSVEGTAVSVNCLRASPQAVTLWWPDTGAIAIKEGRTILVDPLPGAEAQLVRLVILGPALAVVLQQRGYLVLHASAVAVGGAAVAFLGHAGWGKSTTAAALYAQGHGLVTDDVLAVDVSAGRPLVLPGFPQLKLMPEAARALGHDPERLPCLETPSGKRGLRATRGFPRTLLPLRRVYVLAEGGGLQIERLRPQEALVELIRHSYAPKLLRVFGTSTHFLRCARLANGIPTCRLRVARSLLALPDLARLVEADLADAS